MEKHKEKQRRMSVPEFGGWDRDGRGADAGYTMVFSRARADKKLNKNDFNLPTYKNEHDVVFKPQPHHHHQHHHHHHQQYHYQHHNHQHEREPDDSVVRKRKVLTYLNCCIRP